MCANQQSDCSLFHFVVSLLSGLHVNRPVEIVKLIHLSTASFNHTVCLFHQQQ